jgi:molecular chaperone HtpG
MCKTDRENYEKYWDDISPFIKYGCIKDEKFSERMMDYILYKDIDGKYQTMKELLEANKGETAEGENASEELSENSVKSASEETAEGKADEAAAEDSSEDSKKEPEKTTIYYVTDETQQSQYINMFREAGQTAVILRHNIDSAFISHVERLREDVKFQRIDADVTETFREEVSEDELKEQTDQLTSLFRKALGNEKLNVKVEKLKNASVSSVMTLSEEGRRMQDMMKMYNMYGMDPDMFPADQTLILNSANVLVQYLLANPEGEYTELICKQLYDLAMLANRPLNPEEMTAFFARSNEIMTLLAK